MGFTGRLPPRHAPPACTSHLAVSGFEPCDTDPRRNALSATAGASPPGLCPQARDQGAILSRMALDAASVAVSAGSNTTAWVCTTPAGTLTGSVTVPWNVPP